MNEDIKTTALTTQDDLKVITSKVSTVSDLAFDERINLIGLIGDMTCRLHELKQQAEDAAIEYIGTHGEQVIGVIRYYVGPNKTTKPIDLAKAAEGMLNMSGGDWQTFTDCLSSGAFKPGACRKLFELNRGDFNAFFETVETNELREGKPKLQKFDPRFVK